MPSPFITRQIQNSSALIDEDFRGIARARDLHPMSGFSKHRLLFFTGSVSVSAGGNGYILRRLLRQHCWRSPPSETALLELTASADTLQEIAASARMSANRTLLRLAARSLTTSNARRSAASSRCGSCADPWSSSSVSRGMVLSGLMLGSTIAEVCNCCTLWSGHPCRSRIVPYVFFACPFPVGDLGRSCSLDSRSPMGRTSVSCLLLVDLCGPLHSSCHRNVEFAVPRR